MRWPGCGCAPRGTGHSGRRECSGLTALVLARKQARKAGGDLLLAAPQDQVLRVLAATRLTGVFAVHASVGQAAGRAGRSPLMAEPVP
jgi:hypothetical protein